MLLPAAAAGQLSSASLTARVVADEVTLPRSASNSLPWQLGILPLQGVNDPEEPARRPAGQFCDALRCLDGGQLLTVSPLRGRTKDPDEACAQAVALARRAAEDLAGAAAVGDYVTATSEGDRVVTHLFRCLDPAYKGWCWAVTVARASRAKHVTVDECLLLPGPEAILAPDWVPWRERLRPGDLGVGDILPAPPDDARLVPALTLDGDDGLTDWGETEWAIPGAEPVGVVPVSGDADGLAADDSAGDAEAGETEAPDAAAPAAAAPEVVAADAAATTEAAGPDGLEPELSPALGTVPGQARVLSAIGRDDAALRWYTSEHGPRTPLAHAAPGLCSGCGFFVRLAGPLGQVFGVCGNAYAPDDGRVVSADHGCGAHSEAVFPPTADQPLRPVIDELGYDLVDMPGVSVEETVFEPLEHK
jgi:Protein of unknown function (DUF3027)